MPWYKWYTVGNGGLLSHPSITFFSESYTEEDVVESLDLMVQPQPSGYRGIRANRIRLEEVPIRLLTNEYRDIQDRYERARRSKKLLGPQLREALAIRKKRNAEIRRSFTLKDFLSIEQLADFLSDYCGKVSARTTASGIKIGVLFKHVRIFSYDTRVEKVIRYCQRKRKERL